MKCDADVETQVDGRFRHLAIPGQMIQSDQRLLKVSKRLPVGPMSSCLGAGLPEIDKRLVPYFALKRMVGEPLDLLVEPATMQRLDRNDDPGVKGAPTVREQTVVRDLVGQCMPKRVLEVWEEARLIEEFGSLELGQPPAHAILGFVGHGLK